MATPNTLTYERWLEMYAKRVVTIELSAGVLITGRSGDASTRGYELDLSRGSYAVQAHTFSQQLTPAYWLETIWSGTRGTAAASAEKRMARPWFAEWQIVCAL